MASPTDDWASLAAQQDVDDDTSVASEATAFQRARAAPVFGAAKAGRPMGSRRLRACMAAEARTLEEAAAAQSQKLSNVDCERSAAKTLSRLSSCRWRLFAATSISS